MCRGEWMSESRLTFRTEAGIPPDPAEGREAQEGLNHEEGTKSCQPVLGSVEGS